MGELKSSMDLSLEVARRELKRGDVETIASDKAPCKDVILKGSQVDLRQFPIPMHHEEDVGPYFVMACVMRSPENGCYDITFTKNMYYGPSRMSFSAHRHHHLEAMVQEYEKRDKRAPVIIVLGHHPAFYFSSCCFLFYSRILCNFTIVCICLTW